VGVVEKQNAPVGVVEKQNAEAWCDITILPISPESSLSIMHRKFLILKLSFWLTSDKPNECTRFKRKATHGFNFQGDTVLLDYVIF
jgi:hypothetical protein